LLDARPPPQAAHPRRETIEQRGRNKLQKGSLLLPVCAFLEREKGFEPSTSIATLPRARRRSGDSSTPTSLASSSGRLTEGFSRPTTRSSTWWAMVATISSRVVCSGQVGPPRSHSSSSSRALHRYSLSSIVESCEYMKCVP